MCSQSQLVAMEVPVGGDIGDEVHTVDQTLIFTSGKGRAEVGGKKQEGRIYSAVLYHVIALRGFFRSSECGSMPDNLA